VDPEDSDDIVAHVQAMEALDQNGSSDPLSLARMGRSASRIGVLLFAQDEPALAARFRRNGDVCAIKPTQW
jgi:hypothetical protein